MRLAEQYPELVAHLKQQQSVVFASETQGALRRSLTEVDIDFAIPCVFQDKVLGVIVGHNGGNDRHYSSDDLQLFDFLSRFAGEVLYRISLHRDMIESVEKRNVLIQALAGGIAHELRTPLTSISLFADLMNDALQKNDATTSDSLSELIGQTKSHVNFAFATIDMMLNNIRRGEIDKSGFEVTSIGHCTTHAIALYPFKAGQRERITLTIKKDFTFFGSEALFKYILFNLLKNALYYESLQPQLEIGITIDNLLGENTLNFKDNGPGIAPSQQEALFEDFLTSNKADGTGLGLAFCKRTMEAFGGTISCESEPGAFTQFTLVFPVVENTG